MVHDLYPRLAWRPIRQVSQLNWIPLLDMSPTQTPPTDKRALAIDTLSLRPSPTAKGLGMSVVFSRGSLMWFIFIATCLSVFISPRLLPTPSRDDAVCGHFGGE